MFTQAVDSLARWPATAIHDTVAVIVRQDVYQRRLGRSIADRVSAWLLDQLGALFDVIAGTPAARAITLFVTALLVAALAARILFAARFADRPLRVAARGADRSLRHAPTLDEARSLARAGRYVDAMHVLYGAILDALAQRRLIRLHASKTSGDFARELRAREHPALDPFRLFARRFDRLFYGHDACDGPAFDALLGDAERVLRAAATAASS
jgi:hypothetical protein